jgi:hypothetical protein
VVTGKPLKVDGLTCVPKEVIRLLQNAEHYAGETAARLKEAEGKPIKWIDETAYQRKSTLSHAQEQVEVLFDDTLEGAAPTAAFVKQLIAQLEQNEVTARGEPMSPGTCADFEQHFSEMARTNFSEEADPPPYFKCQYTVNKRISGVDQVQRRKTYYYRDGCFCESKWTERCPYRLDLTPTYKDFGFETLEQSEISREAGAYTNALCWYWSNPVHPEWGYQRVPIERQKASPEQKAESGESGLDAFW